MYSARLSSHYTASGLAMGPSFRSPMTFSHRRSRHRGHSWRGCHGVPRQLQGLWEEISLHKSGMWTSQLKRLAKGLPIQPLRASCQFVKNFWLISQPCSAWAFATSKSLAVTNTGSASPRLHIQHTVDLKYSSAKAPVFFAFANERHFCASRTSRAWAEPPWNNASCVCLWGLFCGRCARMPGGAGGDYG